MWNRLCFHSESLVYMYEGPSGRGDPRVLSRRRRAISAVEILVGVAIFASIAIPILSMLYKSREAEQVSRFQYLALIAARDEMYRARFLIGAGAQPNTVAHGLMPRE